MFESSLNNVQFIIFRIGGGQPETNLFPEVDRTWKVCEKFLS